MEIDRIGLFFGDFRSKLEYDISQVESESNLEMSRSVLLLLFLVTRCHSETFSAQFKKFYQVAFFQLPYWRSDTDLASDIYVEAPEKKATG